MSKKESVREAGIREGGRGRGEKWGEGEGVCVGRRSVNRELF